MPPCDPKLYRSCIHDRLFPDFINNTFPTDFEPISAYPLPPWTPSLGTLTNFDGTADAIAERIPHQINTLKTDNILTIFTDGSLIPEEGGGAAISTPDRIISTPVGPSINLTSFEAELSSLKLAVRHFHAQQLTHPHLTKLAIFNDNKKALQSLHNPIPTSSGQYLVLELKTLIDELAPGTDLELLWIPSHHDLEDHDRADLAAKVAKLSEILEDLPFTPPRKLQVLFRRPVSTTDH